MTLTQRSLILQLFLLLKTKKHVLSKSCSELTLKPKSKKISDMNHVQVFQTPKFCDRLRSEFLVLF